MKAGVGVLVAIVSVATVASAQGQSEVRPDEQIRARQRIYMMEGVLERAVQLGVDNLRRRVRAVMPDDALLQGGVAQVRGFPLEGYGVFFDLEVPALRQSLAWSLRTMNETGMALARDLAQIRSFVQAVADPRAQAEFELALRRIQQQIGPTSSVQTVQASPVEAGVPHAVATTQRVTVAAEPTVDSLLLTDPNAAYTQEVKAAVIDAMIEGSGQLMLKDDEWLSVAARDNTPSGPFLSGNPDAVTLVLRIRGADVNAFRAGRLALDQVRARVEVNQF